MIEIKTKTSEVKALFRDLEDLGRDVIRPAFKYFRNITPVARSGGGNARNSTKLVGKTIKAGYPYAGYLDDGSSKQAPRGMTEPTIEEIERLIDKEITKLSR